MALPTTQKCTVFDNFSSGQRWHLEQHSADPRLFIHEGDVKKLDELRVAMQGHEAVIHLASNPDIAKAQTSPDIDFFEGSFLTHQVMEAMRLSDAKAIVYASGSGVYGDLHEVEATEGHPVGKPISTYGASKLAGEALISAYCNMFGLRGRAFRFGNVIGPRQTHGVGYEFVRRLLKTPDVLDILGDGKQSKSYIHVDDVVDAVFAAHVAEGDPFDVFNVATGDYVTVAEIADLAVASLGLPAGSVRYRYSGGDRGWKGDVPIVRLGTARIRALGWQCKRSTRDAMRLALASMVDEIRAGRP